MQEKKPTEQESAIAEPPSPATVQEAQNGISSTNDSSASKPIFTPKERQFRLLELGQKLQSELNEGESDGNSTETKQNEPAGFSFSGNGQGNSSETPRKRGRPSNAERAARFASEGKNPDGSPIEKRTDDELARDLGLLFAGLFWPILNAIAHFFRYKLKDLTESEQMELGRAWQPIARKFAPLAWLSKWTAPILTAQMIRRKKRKLKVRASEAVVDVPVAAPPPTNVLDMSPAAIAARRGTK